MYSPLTMLYQNVLSFCLLSSKWVSTAGAHSPDDGFEGSVRSWILTGPITESGWSCLRLEPTCRLVYFECKYYANSTGSWTALCRKSVSATHCFPPVLKSGHRRAFPFSAHRLAWKFGFVSNFPVKSDGAWRFKRSTVTLNTWAFKFDESNWKLHAYFTVTPYSY